MKIVSVSCLVTPSSMAWYFFGYSFGIFAAIFAAIFAGIIAGISSKYQVTKGF